MIPPILIWRFDDAPQEYRELSEHGGDEDWVAFVPDCYWGSDIPWMKSGTAFGRHDVSCHAVEGGEVRIGAHG